MKLMYLLYMVLFFLIYFSYISPNRYYNKYIRQKKTFYSLVFCYFLYGDCIDVRYQVAIAMFGDEQLYCFSALLLYEEK